MVTQTKDWVNNKLERLLSVLVCPVCHSPATPNQNEALFCSACHICYPIVRGTPIMLDEESRRLLESGQEKNSINKPNRPWKQFLAKIIAVEWFFKFTYPPEAYFDPKQNRRINVFIEQFEDKALVLDLGSGTKQWAPHIVNFDIDTFENVDIVGDGHRLPFADCSFDGIISLGVLEHVNYPAKVVEEAHRILKPGGKIYVGIPFMQGYHPATGTHQDFHRFSIMGLEQLLGRFDKIDSGVGGGPSSSIAWLLREYFPLLFCNKDSLVYQTVYRISGWLTFWIKYLDLITAEKQLAYRIASGFYFIGKKRD